MAKQRASEVLTLVAGDLAGQFAEAVRPALADEPDAVHRLRAVVRRLRSVLAAFDECFEDVADLRAGLAEGGERLGQRRDAEVRLSDARAAVDALGPASAETAALLHALEREGRAAQAALVSWAHGERARDLSARLAVWGSAPDFSEAAAGPARPLLRSAVRRERRRLLRRLERLAPGAEEPAHDARRAGRRLRHVAEAVAPFLPTQSRERAAVAGELGREVQGLLGEHRDALLLARRAEEDGATPVASWAVRRAADPLLGLPAVALALAEEDRI